MWQADGPSIPQEGLPTSNCVWDFFPHQFLESLPLFWQTWLHFDSDVKVPISFKERNILWFLPPEKGQRRWPGVMRLAALLPPQASPLQSQISALLAVVVFSAWTASSFNLWHLYKLGFSRGRKSMGDIDLQSSKGFIRLFYTLGGWAEQECLSVCWREEKRSSHWAQEFGRLTVDDRRGPDWIQT